MIIFILAFAAIFGLIMGAREAVSVQDSGATVHDARVTGGYAALIFGVIGATALFVLYGVAWLAWTYCNWVFTTSLT